MKNTIFALLIPGLLMNAFNVILIRSYFQNNVPLSLGGRDGEEVAQIYIRDCYAGMVRPVMELAGFYRVFLKAGETKRLRFAMRLSQFAFLDEEMRWKVEAGEMELMAGASAGDIRLRDSFLIEADGFVDGRTRGFYGSAEEACESKTT